MEVLFLSSKSNQITYYTAGYFFNTEIKPFLGILFDFMVIKAKCINWFQGRNWYGQNSGIFVPLTYKIRLR